MDIKDAIPGKWYKSSEWEVGSFCKCISIFGSCMKFKFSYYEIYSDIENSWYAKLIEECTLEEIKGKVPDEILGLNEIINNYQIF